MTLFFEYFMAVNVILYGWGVGIEKKNYKSARKMEEKLYNHCLS